MKILVTGGAGYIGSHTVIELIGGGHEVIVVDNLSNSSAESIKRVGKIAGTLPKLVVFDLCDDNKVNKLFAAESFDAVIHFAGLKAVGESVAQPLHYYANNLGSTLNILQAMETYKVHKLIFSSSATVYGDPRKVPIDETAAIHPTNPYGHTKAMIEQILMDLGASNKAWQIIALRYFNPVGAHPSGLIGEDPQGTPNNLLPFVAQVAIGKHPSVKIFGDDYDTPDGTGVRDYIHVVDLARGHLAALGHLNKVRGSDVYNLGSGRGYSVKELIQAFEKASGQKIVSKVVARRPGDIAACYADPTKANKELGWAAKLSLDVACADSWRWQSGNPNGYC